MLDRPAVQQQSKNTGRGHPVSGLLLLVTVLSQAFFPLVGGHFMAFPLFSARHDEWGLWVE